MSPLGHQWLQAARDLRIRVTAPFTLVTAAGQHIEFDALVHEFGAPNGMLLIAAWSEQKAEAASRQGYGFSCMDGGAYDRQSAIEALKDWSWTASHPQP